MRNLYNKTLLLSTHPRASWYLGLVAFTESIFFPIPQDIMMLPMMLANRAKAYFYATVALVFSVLGGIAGYLIGAYLYTEVALPILEMYGYVQKMDGLKNLFVQYGWWIVVVGGFTPIPYKVITITSGAMGLSLPIFIFAAIVSRAMRFYLLAYLTHLMGEKILEFVDKYFSILTMIAMILIISGFVAIKAFI